MCSTGLAAFTARLAFFNLRTGASNAGALEARPGDTMAIHYSYSGDIN